MTTPDTSRKTVLVIDDDPAVLGLMDEKLAEGGYTVLLAQSGSTALEVTARTVPDLVMVDALMPGMNGWDVCAALRHDMRLTAVPIIFMTGLTETEHVIRAFEAGAADYVTKPLRLEEVMARIGVRMEAAARIRSAHGALDHAGRFLFATSRTGAVLWATPQARLILDELAGMTGAAIPLPDTLPAPGGVLMRQSMGENAFVLTLVGATGPDELLLRIARQALFPEKILRDRLGLSAREAEVLLWISRGKTSRDIADILQVSPRTIDKHIEQIYNKTGLSTRAAAAATASRLLQEG
ncbi:DNA-binding response regulator [Komagataeibacter intermedius]|uniref:LuxR family transcriptional regulator n=2 Tax=Komagataeibacter intermedius TaxID=66229 RepID=A0A0C1V7J2_9PROT|nr:DNA-binding response regulator [Komagataeibacter intermedius]KPH86020.1 LuxR family transcriptional regulator [Komagataeibacter intermedius AF2]KPH86406.1 LuxR family transcriptional regulator [Komagataeibacter intermedius AF2]MCF3636910.1 DNA-binding response regulator [Komagataeibacter intermedius]GAN86539.1 two component transcriptional regulator LuxR [Komagataeibacter intermedius TF2]GBQ76233.1 LuxR family transcriptional regulator [Komagataeibacter intermedius NRIC 0521]